MEMVTNHILEIQLKLTVEEAELLRALVQNPVNVDEAEAETKLRKDLFTLLSKALKL